MDKNNSNEEVKFSFVRADAGAKENVEIVNCGNKNNFIAETVPNGAGIPGHPADWKVSSIDGKITFSFEDKEDKEAKITGNLCFERRSLEDSIEHGTDFLMFSWVRNDIPYKKMFNQKKLLSGLLDIGTGTLSDGMSYKHTGNKKRAYNEFYKTGDITDPIAVAENLEKNGNPCWCIPISLLEEKLGEAIVPMENIFGAECTDGMIKAYGAFRSSWDKKEAHSKAKEAKEKELEKKLEELYMAKTKAARDANSNYFSAFN